MPKPTKPGIGGFVTMLLGVFPEFSGTHPAINQHHFPKLSGHHPGGTTMYRYLSCVILLIATTTALAHAPIPRIGNDCPTGTYRSGDYCKPFKSSVNDVIIQKAGNDCPTGYYTSGGSYCKRIAGSERQALPSEDGNRCPSGWRNHLTWFTRRFRDRARHRCPQCDHAH